MYPFEQLHHPTFHLEPCHSLPHNVENTNIHVYIEDPYPPSQYQPDVLPIGASLSQYSHFPLVHFNFYAKSSEYICGRVHMLNIVSSLFEASWMIHNKL